MRFGGFDDYDESRDVEDEGKEKYSDDYFYVFFIFIVSVYGCRV